MEVLPAGSGGGDGGIGGGGAAVVPPPVETSQVAVAAEEDGGVCVAYGAPTLEGLPEKALRRVFEALLGICGGRGGGKASGWPTGDGGGGWAAVAVPGLVTDAAWARAAPAGSTSRHLRRALLGVVTGVEISARQPPAAPLLLGSHKRRWKGGGGQPPSPTAAAVEFARRACSLGWLLPKLPHLAAVSIVCTIPPGAAAHDAEAATEALRLGHDQVLTAAAAHSGVKEVHWAAPAVVPRMLAVLAGRGVEVLHLGDLACQRGGAAAAAARSTTCHLLHRLAPSLHTLHLSSPFCARVGVQGDRALAALLGAAGTLPLL